MRQLSLLFLLALSSCSQADAGCLTGNYQGASAPEQNLLNEEQRIYLSVQKDGVFGFIDGDDTPRIEMSSRKVACKNDGLHIEFEDNFQEKGKFILSNQKYIALDYIENGTLANRIGYYPYEKEKILMKEVE